MLKHGQVVVSFYGTDIEPRIFAYLKKMRPETKVLIQFQNKETKVVRLDELEWEGVCEENPSNSSAY